MEFMEDHDQKSRILENYNTWRKSVIAKNYWNQREHERQEEYQRGQQSQENYENHNQSFANISASTSSSSAISGKGSIETITLEEAKQLILPKLLLYNTAGMNDPLDISLSFARLQVQVFDSLTSTSLLTFETHVQHLLALSNILLIGKKNHPDFDTLNMKEIRLKIYQSVNYGPAQKKFPNSITMNLIDIVNDINSGTLTKLNAVRKIISMIDDDMDPVVIKLLLCVKSMIETLPSDAQNKDAFESQVWIRYLQPILQVLFDEDGMIFKWTNKGCFNDTDNGLLDCPDGCIENDDVTIGYLETKPINEAKDHEKTNRDLYRLGVFSKDAAVKYKLKYIFQIMAVGTNLQFGISELQRSMLTMVELDHFRLPLSMDELPQFIPYLHRLYNVVATIYSRCYKQKNLNGDIQSGSSLEPRVIKAITARTSDRRHENYTYHSCH